MRKNDAYENYKNALYKCAEKTRNKSRHSRGELAQEWTLEQLGDKSILVIGENGIGDEILTSSCLNDLLDKCESISWQCNPKLEKLFTRSFPRVSFVTRHTNQQYFDGTIYSWELIGRLRENLSDFPGEDESPYLKTARSLESSLSRRYSADSKPVVGLAWRSERPGDLLRDKTCSMLGEPAWKCFFEKLKNKCNFVSLQYGDTADELAFVRWKYEVEIYQDESIDIFNNLDAAAAQVSAIDYVVSISTTAAHLAGALRTDGYVLLQEKPFGHWRAGEHYCPWYPSLTPIRQTKAGDWESVLRRVADDLDNDMF